MVTPPPVSNAGAQGSVGDIEASTSPWVIDVDTIIAMPGGKDEDLVWDRAQIEQAPKDLRMSSAQVPDSSPSSPTLPRREIDWNDIPWQEDILEDNEDMRAVRNDIVTLNVALMVSFLLELFLTTFF
jgi:hypothetical protein